MKLRYLKYALETERAGSITKAAQNLFMAQPNLSNALKELEASVGIKIFKRTSQGVETTPEGKEFLDHVRNIVEQVDHLETLYRTQGKNSVNLRIGSVRSSYISHLVTEFINSVPKTAHMKIEYRETTQFELMQLIEMNELDIGMLSFPLQHKAYFTFLMQSKNITGQLINQAPIYLLMSAEHPLAKADVIDLSMLAGYTEIIHGDLDSQEMKYTKWMEEAGISVPQRVVMIYDRGSMMDILSKCHDSYKWTNAIHPDLLKNYNLVVKKCDTGMVICEMVIYSKNRPLKQNQKKLIKRLKEMVKQQGATREDI